MATIVTRSGKGSALTYAEADANFTGLNDEAALNTAKVTNATHTGEVTGDTVLTIAPLAITSGHIAADAVGNDKLANMSYGTIKARTTVGSGNPENATAAEVRTLLNVADGATANSADATLLARANHTGTQLAATISDLATAVAATASVTANTAKVTNATHTGDVTGSGALTIDPTAISGKTLATAVGADHVLIFDATDSLLKKALVSDFTGGATNLTYTAATRVIASDTGTDATLPLMSSGDAGLVPASGGGTTNFLRADGTFAAPGGGGSPGGSSGEVQYNNGGAFAGAADVEIEGGQLRLPTISTPTTPAADGLKLFGRKVGGRSMPAFMGPSGLDSSLQPHFGRNRIAMARPPGNNTAMQTVGLLVTAVGTATIANVSGASRHARMARLEYLVTVAAISAVAGFRTNNMQWTLGASTAGDGGFHMVYRWAPATGVATATQRAFAGMRGSVSAPTDVQPSSLTDICGMGWDAADTNIQFMHNDAAGTATKIDLGASFPVPTVDRTSAFEIALFALPGTTQSLSYEVTDLVSGAVATGTVTSDIPSTTTLLCPYSYVSVGGTSSVVGIAVMSLYIESDY